MQRQNVDLEMIKPGQKALIKTVLGEDDLSFRLKELGFFPGGIIELLSWTPFRWPAAVIIKDSVVALRKEEAKRLLLRKIS
jgi:ferrous iron transport protein A